MDRVTWGVERRMKTMSVVSTDPLRLTSADMSLVLYCTSAVTLLFLGEDTEDRPHFRSQDATICSVIQMLNKNKTDRDKLLTNVRVRCHCV